MISENRYTFYSVTSFNLNVERFNENDSFKIHNWKHINFLKYVYSTQINPCVLIKYALITVRSMVSQYLL